MSAKKFIKTLGLTLVAVFALGAVAVASASAVEWLLNGEPIVEPVPSETKGLIFLKDTLSGVKVHCEGIFDGTVGPGAEDKITAVLTLGGIEVTEAAPLHCAVVEKGTCSATEAQVNAVHLPWKTQLLEEAGGEIRDDILSSGAGEPGYMTVCNGLLVTCEGPTSSKETNLLEGVQGVFDAKSARGKCSDLGEGVIEGEGPTTSTSGTLSVG